MHVNNLILYGVPMVMPERGVGCSHCSAGLGAELQVCSGEHLGFVGWRKAYARALDLETFGLGSWVDFV